MQKENASKKENNLSSQNSRKEQKRLEAELRNKKFNLTKDIVKEIGDVERKIALLEKKEKKLEGELAKEEIYSNPQIAKEKNAEYIKSKDELKLCLQIWEELHIKMQEIESQLYSG
jgi:ATP-binding cassette subfamily F protein 3